MNRLTRRELKTDQFVAEVEHGVEYVAGHRKQLLVGGGIAAVLLLIGLGVYFWMSSQKSARMSLLAKAYTVLDSPTGQPQGDFKPPYATTAERDAVAAKAFQEVMTKYPNSEEGRIAKYFLASQAANQAKWGEAEKQLQDLASSADESTASLAKLQLAQVYSAQNKIGDAEKLLRELIAKPTVMVSKEQATITLGRLLMPTKPAEARKLLEPLRTERSAVSRAAVAALGEGGTPDSDPAIPMPTVR
jgi:predicted negative regulator of RcsB-dependent stress response